MNRSYSRFDSLSSILAGTVAVVGIVFFAAAPVFAKSPQEIAKLAESVTVQINRTDNRGATGFIIAKQGTTYSLLTANHVVDDDKLTYTIRSHTGKNYPVTRRVLLQKGQNTPDLAVVTFNSTESYPVVTLGDSAQATVGTEIFVFGYPGIPPSRKDQAERNFEFVPGYVTSRLPTHSDGYTLCFQGATSAPEHLQAKLCADRRAQKKFGLLTK